MDLKIIQSLLERVQRHKNAGKPTNLWDLKDFSEEQFNSLTIIFSCGLYANIFYVKYLIQVSTK